MFDTGEYYGGVLQHRQDPYSDILDVDRDIVENIEEILLSHEGTLYSMDVYNIKKHPIIIFYPSLGYGGAGAGKLLLSPDRLKFLLSIYPDKRDLHKINRIVIRPRYVETGNVELHSLYHGKTKTLVVYLSHPLPGNGLSFEENLEFIESFEDYGGGSHRTPRNLMKDKIILDSMGNVVKKRGEPLLWSVLSTVDPGGSGEMEKFLLKRYDFNREVQNLLYDISYYYGSHGY